MTDLNAPVGQQRCGLATTSLVLGILGLLLSVVCIGPLLAIPAVICGHIAYSRVRRSAGALTGEGKALGGMITGYIGIALIPIIGLLAAIAIPNFVKARDTAQMNACINNLRGIEVAKDQWALEKNKQEGDLPSPADLDQYLRKGYFSLSCPKGGIYTINVIGTPATCSLPEHSLDR